MNTICFRIFILLLFLSSQHVLGMEQSPTETLQSNISDKIIIRRQRLEQFQNIQIYRINYLQTVSDLLHSDVEQSRKLPILRPLTVFSNTKDIEAYGKHTGEFIETVRIDVERYRLFRLHLNRMAEFLLTQSLSENEFHDFYDLLIKELEQAICHVIVDERQRIEFQKKT